MTGHEETRCERNDNHSAGATSFESENDGGREFVGGAGIVDLGEARIVAVWLISASLFQRGQGAVDFRRIAVVQDGRATVISPRRANIR